MFKNSTKLLFFFTLMGGTLIAISANSWLGAWMGLEINLLSFIPLMMHANNLMSTEASLKYFLTQALASSALLFSAIIFMFFSQVNSMLDYLPHSYPLLMINSTLLLKSGAAPFHFWFPGVMEGLSWTNCLILMTWQKIAPLTLISYYIDTHFFSLIALLSVIIGSLGGLNQTSLRKLMAFSSVNHLGWMIAAMMSKESLWGIYFLTYSFLSFTLIFIFNTFKIFHINQIFSFQMNSPTKKTCLFLSLLSLGGLPPFLGFMPKWLVIQQLSMNNLLFLTLIMVCMTLITLYFYIRICYASFMMNYWEISWNINPLFNNLNMKMVLILSFFSSTGLLLINMNMFML